MTGLTEDQLHDRVPLNPDVRSVFPCPTCGHDQSAQVFVSFYRWGCGHSVPLPTSPRGL